jgi:tRNA-specific 2-thiouridylase
VGKRPFKAFIREFIADNPGKFVDIDSGKILGEHQGIHHWTLGQRTGLWDVKGSFVYKKDVSTNTIYCCSGTNHPLLFSDLFFTEDPYWIRKNPLEKSNVFQCEFRFQHTKPKVACRVCKSSADGSKLLIKLSTPLRSLTPGQYAVFYKEGECLGSSRIFNSGTATYK